MSKTLLAREVVKFVKNGMVVGLGSGTTAREFIKALSEVGPRDVVLVPTSADSEILAVELGLGGLLKPLWAVDRVDLAVDGADEGARRGLAEGEACGLRGGAVCGVDRGAQACG
jgi:ribose 5-phosphate isomerase A